MILNFGNHFKQIIFITKPIKFWYFLFNWFKMYLYKLLFFLKELQVYNKNQNVTHYLFLFCQILLFFLCLKIAFYWIFLPFVICLMTLSFLMSLLPIFAIQFLFSSSFYPLSLSYLCFIKFYLLTTSNYIIIVQNYFIIIQYYFGYLLFKILKAFIKIL